MIITFQVAGNDRILDTDQYGSPVTTGALFENKEFREDFSIADRAIPAANGQAVDGSTELNESTSYTAIVPASSKS
jgi:hypothetical protein